MMIQSNIRCLHILYAINVLPFPMNYHLDWTFHLLHLSVHILTNLKCTILKNAHQNLQAMLTSNLPLSINLQISHERNCPQNWSPLYLAWSNCINYCRLVFLFLSTWSVAHYQTPHLNSNQSHPHTSTNTKFMERTSKLGPQHCMNWCLQIIPKPSYIPLQCNSTD